MIKDFAKSLLRNGLSLPRNLLSAYMEWSLLREVLLDLDINCVLDVGAARGQFATNLRKIGYRGLIVSFEPVKEAYAELDRRLHSDPLWRGYNIALGDQDTMLPFNVAVVSTEMSSFLQPVDPSWDLRTEQVQVRRLDSLYAELVRPIGSPKVFLKMDTQGYDIEVIKGAAGCLGEILAIQSEVCVDPTYQGMTGYLEALGLYERLGYRLVGISEIARSSKLGNISELNCVLTKGAVRVA